MPINPETGLGYLNKCGYKHHTFESGRDGNLRRNYGISLKEWNLKFELQGSICAICGSTKPHGKNWHTDHNHTSGDIRGILCGWCNTALGKFQESPSILKSAINYLDKFRKIPKWSFQDICNWANSTFGQAPDIAVLINRADKEFVELYSLIEPNDVGQVDFDPTEAAEEIADTVIVLAQACAFLGYDLQEEIDKKMDKNVDRKWNTTGNGVGQHV